MAARNHDIDIFVEKAITLQSDDCLIWPFSIDKKGYARTHRFGRIGRYVCTKVYGLPPTFKHQAAHSPQCISKACVNPQHLRWATQLENMADDHRGEDHWSTKLTEEQVLAIRKSIKIMSRTSLKNITFRFTMLIILCIIAHGRG